MRLSLLAAVLIIAVAATVGLTREGHASHPRPVHTAAAPTPTPSPDVNPIPLENQKAGTSAWRIQRAARTSLQGFASSVSVRSGENVDLYVSTTFPAFDVELYRMGWYGGAGARLVWTKRNIPGSRQLAPTIDHMTRMVETSWTPSLTVPVDSSWVTGVYLAKLIAPDGSASYVPFTVLEGTRRAPFVFQSSVTTWQAYNDWGGHSLYVGAGAKGGRSTKERSTVVSFDRPYSTGGGAGDFPSMELPFLQWLEREGYDIAYATSVDVDQDPSLLAGRRAFLSMGHDEYWSTAMRDHVEQAAASGVNLAFLGANAMYRHIRFESSPLGAARREVNYRVAHADPMTRTNPAESTVQWRDYPVHRPEDAVLGAMYECNPVHADAVVYDPVPWLFRGTGLHRGDRITGLIGREYDRVLRDGSRPRRLWVLFRSPVTCAGGRSVADTTLARFPSGAAVFDAATQGFVCAFSGCPRVPVDERVERLVHNLLDAYLTGVPAGPEPRPFTISPRVIHLPHPTQQHPEQVGPSSGVRTIPSATPRKH